jgi:hypothetical protein
VHKKPIFVDFLTLCCRIKSKGFWRWCVIICNSVFLDFVYRLYFNKITFRKLDLLPSSGTIRSTETLAVEPSGWASLRYWLRSEASSTRGPNRQGFCPSIFTWRGLRPAQPGGPTARVSVLPILPEDGRRSSFRNEVILLNYRRWAK